MFWLPQSWVWSSYHGQIRWVNIPSDIEPCWIKSKRWWVSTMQAVGWYWNLLSSLNQLASYSTPSTVILVLCQIPTDLKRRPPSQVTMIDFFVRITRAWRLFKHPVQFPWSWWSAGHNSPIKITSIEQGHKTYKTVLLQSFQLVVS